MSVHLPHRLRYALAYAGKLAITGSPRRVLFATLRRAHSLPLVKQVTVQTRVCMFEDERHVTPVTR